MDTKSEAIEASAGPTDIDLRVIGMDPLHDQPAPSSGQLMRPARALLGWLPAEQGEMFLASNRVGVVLEDRQRNRVRQAIALASQRTEGVDQTDVISAPPPILRGHIDALRAHPVSANMFVEGWDVAVVDLTRICAFQPVVFTDAAAARVGDADPGDLEAIAAVTLPTAMAEPPTIQFDAQRQTFVVISPNPNLRIVGQMNGPVAAGSVGHGLGFVAQVMPSFVQVARYQGRYYLRDGYHRAYGLLAQGITHAPAFVRELTSVEELAPPGMLPQAAYLGTRPPLLTDYANEQVAETVYLPASQKMIIVQAMELTPTG